MSAKTTRKKNLLAEMKNDMDVVGVAEISSQVDDVISVIKKPQKMKNVPWYPPSDRLKKELKQLALDEETTMSKLLTEGVSLVFKSRGKTIDL